MDIWEKCDILITADEKLLKKIPNNKVCVKIKTPYNKEIKKPNGGEYESLLEFISDKDTSEH